MKTNNISVGLQITILVLSIFFCIILSSLISGLFFTLIGYRIEQINLADPKTYLIQAFFSQIIGFFGGLFLFFSITKQKFTDIVKLKKPNFKLVSIVITLLFVAYPLMVVLSYFNSFIEQIIPNNYFILQEKHTIIYQQNLMRATGITFFFGKLIVIAILPAVAEELVFRGVLQSRIYLASNKNEHYAIFVSSLIFAGTHLQPTKLIPMILLGMVLGYIYTRTKNIIYPILFHFLFNLTSILLGYFQ